MRNESRYLQQLICIIIAIIIQMVVCVGIIYAQDNSEKISIVHNFPPGHPIFQGINTWIEYIQENSKSPVQFVINNPRTPPQLLNEAMQDGDIIIYYTGYNRQYLGPGIVELNPSKQFAEQLSVKYWQFAQKYWQRTDNYANAVPLGFAVSPAQYLYLAKPIKNIGDLKNLRIAHNSENSAILLQMLGAKPVPLLGASQLIDGVRAGLIDGAILGNDNVTRTLLTRDLPIAINFGQGVNHAIFAIIMKKERFSKLPAPLQKLFANGKVGALIGQSWDNQNTTPPQLAETNSETNEKWQELTKQQWQKYYSHIFTQVDVKELAKEWNAN